MKIIRWNCRGLGNPCAVRDLLRLIRLENLEMVFLMETRLKHEEVLNVKFKCGFKFCQIVDCMGNGGNIARVSFLCGRKN